MFNLQINRLHVIFFFVLLLQTSLLSSQTLIICIEEVRNKTGIIRLAFYHNDEEFQSDKPFRTEILRKDTLSNNAFCVQYDKLKKGTYGIALLDDENENNQMDYKLLQPKEGFGFSNYYPEGLKRPKFEDFKFTLGKNNQRILIRIRYMK